jgi:hypothetical protein
VFQVLCVILALKVTLRTSTLVIIYEVVARTWKAGAHRAVWNIATDMLAILNFRLETVITVARVVLKMNSSRIVVIHTATVWSTHVSLAVVHVDTAWVW